MNARIRNTILALVAAGLAQVACAGGQRYDLAGSEMPESPLSGDALVQRKHDLDRAYRDLIDFQATLQSLIDRQDGRSITLFDNFLASYIDQYLDPLLRAQWQSNHAELAAVDASLRFAKAELLIEMRYPRRVQDTIDDIQRRFKGRESLLIEYPIGQQGSLGDGLEILKDRKWKG